MNKNLYKVTVVPKLDKAGKPLVDDVWYVPAYTEDKAKKDMESTKNVEEVVSVEFSGCLSSYW